MWCEGRPLWAAAKLIQFSFEKTPWAGPGGVQEFLDTELLRILDPTSLPTTGDLDCYLGKQ